MLVFHGTGRVAIEVESVLEFQQARQVGRLGDMRLQSCLDQVDEQDVRASQGFGLLAQPGQNRLVNANRQGSEAFDPIDQDGLAEQGLVGTIGINQRLEPIPLGQTVGVLLLVQKPVGGGPDFLDFLGLLGGQFGRLREVGGLDLDRLGGLDGFGRLGGGCDGNGRGRCGFLFQRESGAHGLRGRGWSLGDGSQGGTVRELEGSSWKTESTFSATGIFRPSAAGILVQSNDSNTATVPMTAAKNTR